MSLTQKSIQDYKIGLLGGGQLGRMMIQSGLDFNLEIHVLDPDKNAPCKDIASHFTVGSFQDKDTVLHFAKDCDLITIEIENVNVEALYQLEREGKKIFPQPSVIEILQNKTKQKQFYRDNAIPTAEFIEVHSLADIEKNKNFLPAFNKLSVAGYDGRGVQYLSNPKDISKGFAANGILESAVEVEKEISLIIARNEAGEIRHFPLVESVFLKDANLVDYLLAPATVTHAQQQEIETIAYRLMNALNMVGLLAIEFFIAKNGDILVNESAPRPHNSGHHTIEANITSQFEQHLRAILNCPLGDTYQQSYAGMVNLLGQGHYEGLAVYAGLRDVLQLSNTHIHLYGKKLTKPFRKMGHVTVLGSDKDEVKFKLNTIKQQLKVIT